MNDGIGDPLAPIPTAPWRCDCPVRSLLGIYAETGGVHIVVTGRRESAANYWMHLGGEARLVAHCVSCHRDKVLYVEPGAGIRSRDLRPDEPRQLPAGCKCVRLRADDGRPAAGRRTDAGPGGGSGRRAAR